MKLPFYLFFFLITSLSCLSQENNQLWLQYHFNTRLNNKWYWHQDFNIRFQEKDPTISTLAYRTGLGFKINGNLKVLMGAAYFESNPTLTSVGSELRPYQEFIYSLPKATKFRLRLEQRITFGERFLRAYKENWLRYRLFLQKSFVLIKNKNSNYHFNMGNEIFLNLYTKDDFHQNLDQNRFMLSISKNSRNHKFEILYNHNIYSFDTFKNFFPIVLIKMIQNI